MITLRFVLVVSNESVHERATPRSHRRPGAERSGQVHSGPVLVDIGRGGVIDEPAQVHALPQPAHRRVVGVRKRATVGLISGNLRRYLAGDELLDRGESTLLY